MTKTTKILLAAAAGFVAGVLLAPKSGEATRKDIKRKALYAREYADDKKEQAIAAAREAGLNLKETATRTTREVMGMAESARTSADVLGEEAKTRASRVANDSKRTAGRVKKTAEKVAKP
jgi:gas vesicle protein